MASPSPASDALIVRVFKARSLPDKGRAARRKVVAKISLGGAVERTPARRGRQGVVCWNFQFVFKSVSRSNVDDKTNLEIALATSGSGHDVTRGLVTLRVSDFADLGSDTHTCWVPMVGKTDPSVKISVFFGDPGTVAPSEFSDKFKVVTAGGASGVLAASPIGSFKSKVRSLKKAPTLFPAESAYFRRDDAWRAGLVERKGSLRVTVHEAKDLVAADSNGKSDPYVAVVCHGLRYKTKVVKGTLDPQFENAVFDFPGENGHDLSVSDEVSLVVKDWDRKSLVTLKDDDLGNVVLPLAFLPEGVSTKWYKLSPSSSMLGCSNESDLGWLKVTTELELPQASDKSPEFLAPASSTRMMSSGGSMAKMSTERPTVTIKVLQARGLPAADANGKSDPYLNLRLNGDAKSEFRTRVVKKTLDPVWDEEFQFGKATVLSANDHLEFTVRDRDFGFGTMNDDDLGFLKIPLWSVMNCTQLGPRWYALESEKFPLVGFLELEISYEDPSLVKKQKSEKDLYKGKVWLYELAVTVLSGKNLAAADEATRSSDPYCILRCGMDKYETRVVKQSLNPVWQERFRFKQSKAANGRVGLGREDSLKITVMDWDKGGGHDPLGSVALDLGYLVDRCGFIDPTGASFVDFFKLSPPASSDKEVSQDDDAAAAQKKSLASKVKSSVSTIGSFSKSAAAKSLDATTHFVEELTSMDSLSTKASSFAHKLAGASSPADFGKIQLKIQLTPIGESRMQYTNKLCIDLQSAEGLLDNVATSKIGPLDNFAQFNSDDPPTHPSSVYAMIRFGHEFKISPPVLFRSNLHGTPRFDYKCYFEDDVDWLLNDALYPSVSHEKPSDLLQISVRDSKDDSVVAAFEKRLSEMLKIDAKTFKSEKIDFRESEAEVFPLTITLNGGGEHEADLRCRVAMSRVKETLQPILGYFVLDLKSIKYHSHGFQHKLTLVLRFEDKTVVSNVPTGSVSHSFEDVKIRFPVKNVFKPVEVEIWDDVKAAVGTSGEEDDDEDVSTSSSSNKWGKLVGVNRLTAFELIELEAQMVFAEESVTKCVTPKPFKFSLNDVKKESERMATLWLTGRYVENPSGILATNPNPCSLAYDKKFSIREITHEINRLNSVLGYVSGFQQHVGSLLDWESPPKTIACMALIVLFCVSDAYSARWMFLFPFALLTHVVNRHRERADGTFLQTFDAADDESDLAATVRVSIVEAKSLLHYSAAPSQASSFVKLSLRAHPASKIESVVGWTRTVLGEDPDFSLMKGGFGVKKSSTLKSNLTQWKAPGQFSAKPTIELKTTNHLVLKPLLAVTINRAKNLLAADTSGTSDPYVTMWIESHKSSKSSTVVRSKTLTPVWDQRFVLGDKNELSKEDFLCLQVLDSDGIGSRDDVLGVLRIPLSEVGSRFKATGPTENDFVVGDDDGRVGEHRRAAWLPLQPPPKLKSSSGFGEILMSVSWLDDFENESEEEPSRLVAPDSWMRCGAELLIDAFGDNKQFIGRVVLPVNSLIEDEDHREQTVFDAWLSLGKKFDGSRADEKLTRRAERLNVNCLGEVRVLVGVSLPDPANKERQIALDEAKRAEKLYPWEKFQVYKGKFASLQATLNALNNKGERVKNLFNWAHPRRTEFVFKGLMVLCLVFALIPSRFIIMAGTVFMFTEKFRPMGSMGIKFKHMLALLPTDDDLRALCYGDVATAKLLESSSSSNVEAKAVASSSASSKPNISRFASSTGLSVASVGKIRKQNITLADASFQSHLRFAVVKQASSVSKIPLSPARILKSLASKMKSSSAEQWKRVYFICTPHGLSYWLDKSKVEVKSADGHFLNLKSVSELSDSNETKLTRFASKLIRVEDGEGRLVLLSANSDQKTELWLRHLKGVTASSA